MPYTDRSIRMKIALLFALVAVAAAMEGFTSKQKFIDGQFIICIDESMTKTQVHEFSIMIEKKFKIYVVKSYNLKSAKFVFVKGEHAEVMKLKSLSGIKYIQCNMIHSIQQCAKGSAAGCWGLDRADQRDKLTYSDPLFDDASYVWGESMGESTVAYIADTGIDVAHLDFSGRAVHGYTAGEIPTDDDENGHGTHIAGTVGSNSYGIAKGVQLVSVKVYNNGFASTSPIIDGLEWIQNDHNSRGNGAKSVVSLALGGGANDAFDDAIAACVAEGIVVVVAAGNDDANACQSSPSREPTAITVGATDINDVSAWFSNYGECVDIFAPGVDILSTTPKQSTSVFSGTSMAVPHVVGVVARYMDSLPTAPTPEQVSFGGQFGFTL